MKPEWKFCLGVLLVALLVPGCSKEQPSGRRNASSVDAPDQVFVGTRFVITEDGATSAIVAADSITVFQSRRQSIAEGRLRVDFFSRAGARVSTLTADRGIVYGVNEVIDSLRAEGNVVITWHERNATMKTPFVRWIERTRTIYADSTVALSVDNAVERGVGFVAPDDLKSYTMRQVAGVVEDQRIEIPGR